MDVFEFELRYLAFLGLKKKFALDRDEQVLLALVKISDQGVFSGKIQDISPEEIKQLTIDSYTDFKQNFLEQNTTILYLEDPLDTAKKERLTLDVYIERLEYELKVIKEMWFNTYFLIVSDFVTWAKEHEIMVGPGRGSGAGSLLAWVINITDVDPLPYGLLFERFLNPARITMPDFDIDFDDEKRELVIDYVANKYGHDKVSSIGTFMKLAKKAAFKDVARVLGLSFDLSNKFSALIPEKEKVSEVVRSGEATGDLKTMYDGNEIIRKAVDLWEGVEGNMRQLWIHACGVIIAPGAVSDYSPVGYIKEDDHTVVSQYDGPTLETIGLLKMDFLGLRNLTIIRNCIKIILAKAESEGEEIPKLFQRFLDTHSFTPPLDDTYTYDKIFKKGDTTGIFQFESQGMRNYLVKLKANSINDLIAMNALYRPWPMEFIPNYIHRKHGEEEIEYMYPELKSILSKKYWESVAQQERQKLIEDLSDIMDVTYGIAVFQEQLMFLVQSMAGFSLAEADILRRGVGKKKIEVIEKIKKEFIQKSASYRQYKPETAQIIYEKMIEPAASYSFNKSHSVCYSWIAFQTAYLKAHYPLAFYASLIRSVENDTDDQSNYIKEVQNHGIYVKGPDINESFNHVAAIKDYIRLWFCGIKGVGSDVGEFIQKERQKNWTYDSLEDFLKRCDVVVNRKSLESLIKSGAFDAFYGRKTLLEHLNYLLDWSKSSQTMDQGLFGASEVATQLIFQKEYPMTLMEKLTMEYDVLRVFVSEHVLDWLYPYIKKTGFLSQLEDDSFSGPFRIIGFISGIQRARKKWFFIKIEDISGEREFFFPEKYNFELFDMLIMYGEKKPWRYPNPTKIVKTSREKLIQLAGRIYDADISLIDARKMRIDANEIPKPTMIDTTDQELIDTVADESWEIVDVNDTLSLVDEGIYHLPEDITKIEQLKKILANNQGTTAIKIWDFEFLVNQEGVVQLEALLGGSEE